MEAQSPYYKLLIGRILGYRPDNIAHYVQVRVGPHRGRALTGTGRGWTELKAEGPMMLRCLDPRSHWRGAARPRGLPRSPATPER